MRMPEPSAHVEARAAPVVQRVEASAGDIQDVDPATEHAIQSLSGRGSALPPSIRSYMEPRFNADFSTVRVHDDAHAHGLARAVNAQAFTIGPNVVFGAGRYSPHSESGRRLLAHELTHVVQQSSAGHLDAGSNVNRSAVLQRQAGTSAKSELPGAGASSVALPNSVEALFQEKKSGLTTDELASASFDVKTLPPHDVRDAILRIEQYFARQRTSSFKSVRLEAVLESLYRRAGELNLQIAKAEAAGRRGARRKGKAPDYGRKPRVLAEHASVGYASPAEARAEYDLVMQWLTHPDLPRGDRRILNLERANLEWLLDSDQQRAAAERHSARVRAALSVRETDPAKALLAQARTIEGIRKDSEDDRIHWLYYQGEAFGLSAEQAAGLRTELSAQLQKAGSQLFSLAAVELRRRDERAKRNEDHWLRARVAEIFEGHLWGEIHDPVLENLSRFPRIWEDLKTLQRLVAEERLVDAAALLPEIEALYEQIKASVDAFVHGYEEGEARAITTLEITAAVAAAVAVGLAAAALAPMVATYVSAAVGVEGLGLTGVAGAVATTVGTTVTTGVLLGTGVGLARGAGAFGASLAMGGSLGDAWNVTKEQAAEGFVDGLLAGTGAGAGAALGRAVGVGTNLAFQAARRAGTEAVVNGTLTLADKLAHGASLDKAIEAATRSALLSVPGSLVGSGNLRKLIAGTMASAGNAYLSARWDNQPPESALQAAAVAVATHLAVSRVGHGNEESAAKWARRGASHGKALRGTVGAAPSSSHTPAPESVRAPSVTEESRPIEAGGAEADADQGLPATAKKPFVLTERELQHRAAEAVRRPVKDLDGKVHFYKTQKEYEAEFLRKYPKERPPRGYFEPDTGDIHVSPRADAETAIHETTHSVREDENRWGRAYVGAFLDEGVTDAIARGRKAGGAERSAYKKNIAFYHLLERTLGGKVVERAILHGEYAALRTKVRELFGGSEARTFEFFNRLRAIGPRVQNPAALDQAVAMLEAASGRPAWQLSREAPSRLPAADSPNARIEKAGPFSFLGTSKMRGRVLYRRIGALTRSGGPIAEGDMSAFMKHMVADARAAGATRLRLFPEFIEQPNLADLNLLAGAFGGTAQNVGSIYKIEIPISDEPARTGTTAASPRAKRASPGRRVEASETDEPDEGTARPVDVRETDTAVMSDEEFARRQAEVPALTPEQLGEDRESETIGEYVLKGSKKTDGPVFHRTIEEIDHIGEKARDLGPLNRLIRLLLREAHDAGASTLRISGTKVDNRNVLGLEPLAKRLNGTFRVVSETEIEIEVPVPRPPATTAAPAGVDTEVTERTSLPFEESPEPDEPNRYSGSTKAPDAGDDGGSEPADPAVPTDQDVQFAAAEAFRQPMRDLSPWISRYRTRQAYMLAYARTKSHEPLPLGWFDPRQWMIRLPPGANLRTTLHEGGHLVSFLADETSRQFLGGFLDEGFTQATVNSYLGHDDQFRSYEPNVAFYRMLARALGGSRVIENAFLFGQRKPLVARLEKLFGRNKALTERFLERLRSIGANGENPVELGAAVAMIEDATGRPAWEMAPGSPAESGIASSIPESEERLGPHIITGSKRLEPHVGGNVLVRLIKQTNLSAADLTPEGLGSLFETLRINAKLSDATRLRVYPRFLDNHEIGSVRALAGSLGGTATRLNGVTEIELPALDRTASGRKAFELGLPQKSFVLTNDDVFEEFDPTRTVVGPPPDEYFPDRKRYVGPEQHAEYLKSAGERLKGGGKKGGPSGSSAPSSSTPPAPGSAPPAQAPPTFKYRAEIVGEFTISGTRELEGNVLHRRIDGLFGHEGERFEWGPIKRMFLLLLDDARVAGATRLRLTPEKVFNKNVLKLRRLIEFGLGPDIRGTVRQIGNGEIEIDIPLPDSALIHDPAALPRPTVAAGEIDRP
jgi:hypothetical protein